MIEGSSSGRQSTSATSSPYEQSASLVSMVH
jgi:hypothetical protein